VPDLEAKLAEVTAVGATVKEPAHDVGGGRLVAAEAKENQTYCSKLVRSSQATPTETAMAAPPNRWRHYEHGHENGPAVA